MVAALFISVTALACSINNFICIDCIILILLIMSWYVLCGVTCAGYMSRYLSGGLTMGPWAAWYATYRNRGWEEL